MVIDVVVKVEGNIMFFKLYLEFCIKVEVDEDGKVIMIVFGVNGDLFEDKYGNLVRMV